MPNYTQQKISFGAEGAQASDGRRGCLSFVPLRTIPLSSTKLNCNSLSPCICRHLRHFQVKTESEKQKSKTWTYKSNNKLMTAIIAYIL